MMPSSSWRQSRFPADFRIIVFCLLCGVALGWLLGRPMRFAAPLAPSFVRSLYQLSPHPALGVAADRLCHGALLLLPVWSVVFLRSYPVLLCAGVLTFVLVFIALSPLGL